MNRLHAWPAHALLVLLLLFGAPATADEREAPAAGDGIDLALFDVHALVGGRQGFVPASMGVRGPDDVNDEERPLFGGEDSDLSYPHGDSRTLPHVVSSLLGPQSKAAPGSSLRGLGDRHLAVRAGPAVIAEVARVLGELEHAIATVVRVEVLALTVPADLVAEATAGSTGLALDDATVATLAEASGALLGASLATSTDVRSTTVAGRQVAYVIDSDVEVAKQAQAFDPLVSVASFGLAVGVRARAHATSRTVSLDLEAEVARLDDLRTSNIPGDLTIELIRAPTQRFQGQVVLPVDRWCLIDGSAGASGSPRWTMLARATVEARPRVVPARAHPIEGLEAGDDATRTRRFDAQRVSQVLAGVPRTDAWLWPSHFNTPEPGEMPDPAPWIASDDLTWLLRQAGGTAWQRDALRVENGAVYAHTTPTALAGVGRILEGLAGAASRAVVADGEIVVFDQAPFEATLSKPGDALTAALSSGNGRVIERARIISLGGTRKSVAVGDDITYVADYAVELVDGSAIGNPVVQRVLSGLMLDVTPLLSGAGGAVEICVRGTRSRVPMPMRTLQTPHGDVELPEMDWFRARTTLRAPLGERTVVATARDGDRVRVLVVTPRRLGGE